MRTWSKTQIVCWPMFVNVIILFKHSHSAMLCQSELNIWWKMPDSQNENKTETFPLSPAITNFSFKFQTFFALKSSDEISCSTRYLHLREWELIFDIWFVFCVNGTQAVPFERVSIVEPLIWKSIWEGDKMRFIMRKLHDDNFIIETERKSNSVIYWKLTSYWQA